MGITGERGAEVGVVGVPWGSHSGCVEAGEVAGAAVVGDVVLVGIGVGPGVGAQEHGTGCGWCT